MPVFAVSDRVTTDFVLYKISRYLLFLKINSRTLVFELVFYSLARFVGVSG